ncbi:hypothetical protein PR003_g18059 [Phytophthora rubi]|uniref:Uncharacterized protein n=2 Tax=Phytophthora rubi TaxID=129364 RepID=A0A6A4E3K2_9STRA|nr:hypothetical protein PR003_g18059 [Phytophthora rubi]
MEASAQCHETLWKPCELLELRETLLVNRVRITVSCGRKCVPSVRRTRSLDEDVEARSGRMSRVEMIWGREGTRGGRHGRWWLTARCFAGVGQGRVNGKEHGGHAGRPEMGMDGWHDAWVTGLAVSLLMLMLSSMKAAVSLIVSLNGELSLLTAKGTLSLLLSAKVAVVLLMLSS